MSLISHPTMRQFFVFAGVGAIGTLGHYLTLIVLVEIAAMQPVLASTAGFVVGALINYVLNYRYTFNSSKPHRQALLQFFIVAIIGAVLNSLIMYIGTVTLTLNYLLAQIIATGLVLIQNFILNKTWTFASHHSQSG